MTDRDAIVLTPFRQWRKYRHFPIEIVLHALIVVFITFQALMLTSEFIPYNRANEQTLREIFYKEEYREGIFTINDTFACIEEIVENYYAFPDYSVERYDHLKDNTTVLAKKPIFTVRRYKELDGPFWDHSVTDENTMDDEDIHGDFSTETRLYHLPREEPLAEAFPLQGEEMLNDFYRVVDMELSFTLRGVNVGPLAVLPFEWDVTLYFNTLGGQVEFNILVQLRLLRTSGLSEFDIFTTMNAILLFLSFFSWVLTCRGLLLNLRVFMRTKRRYDRLCHHAGPRDPFPTWGKIPATTKLAFFSFWYILNFTSCVIIMISCVLGLAEELGYSTSAWYMIVYGFGCMLSCLNMMRYLEYNKKFYLHLETLRNSFMNIVTFCVSVSPIYWAYMIFGVLNFGPYSARFRNLDETAVSLFAMLTGDDIHDTFNDIIDGAYPVPFVSRIYLYTWVTLFFTSVLNVFIFIIEDAFHLAKDTLGMEGFVCERDLDRLAGIKKASTEELLSWIFDNLETWSRRMHGGMADDGEETTEATLLSEQDQQSDERSDGDGDDDGDDVKAAWVELPEEVAEALRESMERCEREVAQAVQQVHREHYREMAVAIAPLVCDQ